MHKRIWLTALIAITVLAACGPRNIARENPDDTQATPNTHSLVQEASNAPATDSDLSLGTTTEATTTPATQPVQTQGEQDSTQSQSKTETKAESKAQENTKAEAKAKGETKPDRKKSKAEEKTSKASEPEETKPAETKREASKPAETKPAKTKPAETKPAKTKPAETKPAKTKPAETKPEETKPAETKPEETKPAETKPKETKPAETKPKETKPAETKPKETKPAETKPVETKPATRPVSEDREKQIPAEILNALRKNPKAIAIVNRPENYKQVLADTSWTVSDQAHARQNFIVLNRKGTKLDLLGSQLLPDQSGVVPGDLLRSLTSHQDFMVIRVKFTDPETMPFNFYRITDVDGKEKTIPIKGSMVGPPVWELVYLP